MPSIYSCLQKSLSFDDINGYHLGSQRYSRGCLHQDLPALNIWRGNETLPINVENIKKVQLQGSFLCFRPYSMMKNVGVTGPRTFTTKKVNYVLLLISQKTNFGKRDRIISASEKELEGSFQFLFDFLDFLG
jgi:hypothetical protein